MSEIVATSSDRLPSAKTLEYAVKIAISEDRPIIMDYWVQSLQKKVIIGVRGEEKLLVKSEQEYTSPIVKTFKSDSDLIIKTENSLYIVSVEIPIKKVA